VASNSNTSAFRAAHVEFLNYDGENYVEDLRTGG
jgi:hypothetical protein